MINNRQNNRRRGRGGGPRPNGTNPGNDRGNRIDNRARGNANQLFEKYKTLARDAQTQGDRVMSEYYFQFADHYFRVLNENRSRFEEQNRGRPDQFDRDDQYDDGDDSENTGEGVVHTPRYSQRDYNEQRAQVQQPAPQLQQPVADEPDEAPMTYGANGHRVVAEQPVEEPVRPARGRRPKARAESAAPDLLANVDPKVEETRIEVDRLPPAFASGGEVDEKPKPKRRGRPPRSQSAIVEA